jgi:hypothetical protein
MLDTLPTCLTCLQACQAPSDLLSPGVSSTAATSFTGPHSLPSMTSTYLPSHLSMPRPAHTVASMAAAAAANFMPTSNSALLHSMAGSTNLAFSLGQQQHQGLAIYPNQLNPGGLLGVLNPHNALNPSPMQASLMGANLGGGMGSPILNAGPGLGWAGAGTAQLQQPQAAQNVATAAAAAAAAGGGGKMGRMLLPLTSAELPSCMEFVLMVQQMTGTQLQILPMANSSLVALEVSGPHQQVQAAHTMLSRLSTTGAFQA